MIVELAPAQGLVDLADERDARVIVVGTRGESPIRGRAARLDAAQAAAAVGPAGAGRPGAAG